MIRRRDVLYSIGATVIVGCDGVVAKSVGGPATTTGPTLRAIEAPGIARAPRGDRVAVCALGVAQLRETALWIRDPAGARLLELPFVRTYGLAALPDGALIALGHSDGKDIAVVVSATGQVSQHPVLVVTGEDPIAVLPEPGVSEVFWIVWPDRRTAYRTKLTESYGRLDIAAMVKLNNSAGSDVTALPSGDLVFAGSGDLCQVNSKGDERRVPRPPSDVIERLSPGDNATSVWALALTGGLALIDLATGEEKANVSLGGQGVALAADARGVAVLCVSDAPDSGRSWTLWVRDLEGRPVFSARGLEDPARGLAMSESVVVMGDATRLRVWSRPGGSLLFSEG